MMRKFKSEHSYFNELWRRRIINRPAKVVAVRAYRDYRFEILCADAVLTLIGIGLLISAIQMQPNVLYASDVLQRGGLNRLLATVLYLTGTCMVSVIVALRYHWKAHALPIVIMLVNLALIVIGLGYYDDAVMSIQQDVAPNI